METRGGTTPGSRLRGELGPLPLQRAAPRGEGEKRRDGQFQAQLSATERGRDRRAAAPSPQSVVESALASRAPDGGPSPWQPQPGRPRAPASRTTPGASPFTGATEGEATDGARGEEFSCMRSVGLGWGEEREAVK